MLSLKRTARELTGDVSDRGRSYQTERYHNFQHDLITLSAKRREWGRASYCGKRGDF